MKRSSLPLAAAFLGLLAARAGGAPLGLEVGLEVGADGLVGADGPELHLQPQVRFAFSDSGFEAGLAWELPVYPEANPGSVEAWEELAFVLPGLAARVGNDNLVILDSGDVEGYLYAIGEHGVGAFSSSSSSNSGMRRSCGPTRCRASPASGRWDPGRWGSR